MPGSALVVIYIMNKNNINNKNNKKIQVIKDNNKNNTNNTNNTNNNIIYETFISIEKFIAENILDCIFR
jgi:hypothetical protein